VSGDLDWRSDVDTGRLLLLLDQFPDQLRARMKIVVAQLTNELLSAVEAAEPVRTGTLRRATHAYVDELRSGRIRGQVKVSRESGLGPRFGALEYGAPGQKRAGKKVKVSGYRRATGPVRTYQRRQPHIKALRFLRGPAMARRQHALALLKAAVADAWQGEKPT